LTVNIPLFTVVPALLVHESEYAVETLGETVMVAEAPLKAKPLAVQDVALLYEYDKLADWPKLITDGLKAKVTVGAGVGAGVPDSKITSAK
jgi:hypothetical protein